MADSQKKRETMIDEFWRQATTGLATETKNIAENFRFYCGGDGQWDSETLAELDEDGKPHLSINKCKPTIDLLSGYQRKFRDSLDVFPRRGGTAKGASVLTQMGRHAMDVSCPPGDLVLSEQFMMGAIGGKSWSTIDTLYDHDVVGGDVQPQHVSVFNVLEDPLYRGYDINSNDPHAFCRFLFRIHLVEREQLKLLYPDKKEELEHIDSSTDIEYPHVFSRSSMYDYNNDDYETAPEGLWLPDVESIDGNLKRYLLRICFYKKFKAKAYLFNKETKQVHELGEQIAQAKKMADMLPAMMLLVRIKPELHRCDYIGDVELEYEKKPLGDVQEYPYFRFAPYWIDGKPMGELDNLKDTQREFNKRRSQLLHHLNSSANSGVDIERGSLTPEQEKNYEENGTRAGFVGIYEKGFNPPQSRYPKPISEGHLKLATLSSDDFEDITKLNDATYGSTEGAKESGTALKIRREQGLVVKEPVFDMFNFTQLSFYNHLVERIRRPDKSGNYIYSEEEIFNLIEEYDLNVDMDELRSIELGRYGLKVGRSQTQPTARRDNYSELTQLLNSLSPEKAAEIDLVDILDASDLSNKEKFIERIETRRQQMQEMQKKMMMQQAAGGAVA